MTEVTGTKRVATEAIDADVCLKKGGNERGMKNVTIRLRALIPGIADQHIRSFLDQEMMHFMVQDACYDDKSDMLMVELGMTYKYSAIRLHRAEKSFVQVSWLTSTFTFEERRAEMAGDVLAVAQEMSMWEPCAAIHTKYGVSPMDLLGICHALSAAPSYEMDTVPRERVLFVDSIDPPGGGMGFELPTMWGLNEVDTYYRNVYGSTYPKTLSANAATYILFYRKYVNLIWTSIMLHLQYIDHRAHTPARPRANSQNHDPL